MSGASAQPCDLDCGTRGGGDGFSAVSGSWPRPRSGSAGTRLVCLTPHLPVAGISPGKGHTAVPGETGLQAPGGALGELGLRTVWSKFFWVLTVWALARFGPGLQQSFLQELRLGGRRVLGDGGKGSGGRRGAGVGAPPLCPALHAPAAPCQVHVVKPCPCCG